MFGERVFTFLFLHGDPDEGDEDDETNGGHHHGDGHGRADGQTLASSHLHWKKEVTEDV